MVKDRGRVPQSGGENRGRHGRTAVTRPQELSINRAEKRHTELLSSCIYKDSETRRAFQIDKKRLKKEKGGRDNRRK